MSLKPIELPPAVAPAGRGKSIQAAGARRGGDRSGKRRTMCYSERRVLEERAWESLQFCSRLSFPASSRLLQQPVVVQGVTLRFPARALSTAGALEPKYGTNALSRRARVLPARLASSGSLFAGPVGRPSGIGSRLARNV